jgi:hypothetical protein
VGEVDGQDAVEIDVDAEVVRFLGAGGAGHGEGFLDCWCV